MLSPLLQIVKQIYYIYLHDYGRYVYKISIFAWNKKAPLKLTITFNNLNSHNKTKTRITKALSQEIIYANSNTNFYRNAHQLFH